MFRFIMKPWKSSCVQYSYFPASPSSPVLSHFQILHKDLTAAKFKDCVRSCKVCFFFWKKSIINFFLIHCSYLLSKVLVWAGLHVIVFKELISKLRVHSLEKTKFNYIFERKQLTFICFISVIFLFNLSQALSSDCWFFCFIFRGKSDKYFSAPSRLGAHVTFLGYSYNSCLF